MADIRIKDLTTTASSTASDDFIAVDGTTNGTRKLNAFSPTFGGNATVTGTLTVNGAATSINVTNSGGLLNFSGTGNTTTIKEVRMVNSGGVDWMSLGITGSAYAGVLTGLGNDEPFIYAPATFRIFRGTGLTNRFDFAADQLKINATTASTTTSTGALVVGNGTSGGLGVGGAINCGGNIVLSPASVAASGEVGNLRIADSSNTNRKLFFGLDNTVSPNGVGYIQSTLTGTTTIPLQLQPLGGSLSVGNSGTVVTLNGTTASTSTSSGALVVSGGMGIAKQIVAGGVISIDPLDASPEDLAPEVAFCRGVSLATTASVLAFGSGARIGLLRGYQDGGNLVEWRFGSYIGTTFNEQMRLGGTSATSSSLTLYGTTASTSTSSGALVVSGGVGVAGAINAGGTITSTNGSGSGLLGMRSSSGNASYVFWSETGVADRGILGFNNGSSTLSYRSFSSSFATGTEVFAITSGGNVTAGGSVQTAAPSGGTAAAWKLGTVASVSPTSPNRTIEVDIGGTIYYIHAKTTNN